jgi:hypothetical protein
MPINYSRYPKNWKTEIRPRIMKRANNTCEFDGCDFKHGETVWSCPDEDLAAMCQLHHLRYDAKEKYRRSMCGA